MGLVLTTTAGLMLWIVLWATGVKSFDAFLLTALIVVTAGAIVLLRPFLDRIRGREPAPPEDSGAF